MNPGTWLLTGFIFFSNFQNLKLTAQEALHEARSIDGTRLDEYLVPKERGVWGPDPPLISPESIIKDALGIRELPSTDLRRMQKYTARIRNHEFFLPENVWSDKILSMGAPLLDFLRAYRDKRDGWRFPSSQTLKGWSDRRVVSLHTLRNIVVRA